MNKCHGTSEGLFLKRTVDFKRVKLLGKRLATPLFNIVACPSPGRSARVGIVASRRIGNAVVRNRAKRIFRELARTSRTSLVREIDIVVFPRSEALSTKFKILSGTWDTSLARMSLTTSHAQYHP